MPQPTKPPRLYLNKSEQVWLIRDGPVTRRTRCGALDREGAEKALAVYLGEKFKPVARESDPARLSIAEVLTAYGREHAQSLKAPESTGYAIGALAGWWATKMLTDVRKDECKAYTASRLQTVKSGTARRELAILAAAINYWHQTHGPLTAVPVVTLPEKGQARERWLTRTEAAFFLAGSLGWYRVSWSDARTRRIHHRWKRYALGNNPHLARFILLGLYTGSRRGALLEMQWMANLTGGWVDIERGVMHRRSSAEQITKKRKPPTRLGRRILSHLKIWRRKDARERDREIDELNRESHRCLNIISWRGSQVASVRTAWDAARELAWLGEDVTPHTLRHTRATWVMQAGIDIWEAAGSLGMSVKTLEDVYGHHHPDWQKRVAEV